MEEDMKDEEQEEDPMEDEIQEDEKMKLLQKMKEHARVMSSQAGPLDNRIRAKEEIMNNKQGRRQRGRTKKQGSGKY